MDINCNVNNALHSFLVWISTMQHFSICPPVHCSQSNSTSNFLHFCICKFYNTALAVLRMSATLNSKQETINENSWSCEVTYHVMSLNIQCIARHVQVTRSLINVVYNYKFWQCTWQRQNCSPSYLYLQELISIKTISTVNRIVYVSWTWSMFDTGGKSTTSRLLVAVESPANYAHPPTDTRNGNGHEWRTSERRKCMSVLGIVCIAQLLQLRLLR